MCSVAVYKLHLNNLTLKKKERHKCRELRNSPTEFPPLPMLLTPGNEEEGIPLWAAWASHR